MGLGTYTLLAVVEGPEVCAILHLPFLTETQRTQSPWVEVVEAVRGMRILVIMGATHRFHRQFQQEEVAGLDMDILVTRVGLVVEAPTQTQARRQRKAYQAKAKTEEKDLPSTEMGVNLPEAAVGLAQMAVMLPPMDLGPMVVLACRMILLVLRFFMLVVEEVVEEMLLELAELEAEVQVELPMQMDRQVPPILAAVAADRLV